MNRRKPFLVYTHPVAGQLQLFLTEKTVEIACTWPWDLMTDEWIEIFNEFDLQAYAGAMSTFARVGVVRVDGIRSGSLALRVLGPERVRLDITDDSSERPAELSQILNVHPEAFDPVHASGDARFRAR